MKEFNAALIECAAHFKPDLFFVFKGAHVFAETIHEIRNSATIAIQFYPDTGFDTHSPYLKKAALAYDWFFTTKPDQPGYLLSKLGYASSSFLPHAFDPEVHTPTSLSDKDTEDYACDIGFAGNISAKKYAMVSDVLKSLPNAKLKIWGARAWGAAARITAANYQGFAVWGAEYAKAIAASRINLGLLFEGNPDGGRDLITARTFEIPAAGGFMLHECTEEAMQYFEDGKECVFFDDAGDLVEKIRYYLAHEEERRAIAAAGRARCLSSGYSVDDRVRTIIDKYHELRAARMPAENVTAPTARQGIRHG